MADAPCFLFVAGKRIENMTKILEERRSSLPLSFFQSSLPSLEALARLCERGKALAAPAALAEKIDCAVYRGAGW
jgi:hypothetical protein